MTKDVCIKEVRDAEAMLYHICLLYTSFNKDDIQKIIQHSLKMMSEEDKKIIIEHYGDIEKFKESVAE